MKQLNDLETETGGTNQDGSIDPEAVKVESELLNPAIIELVEIGNGLGGSIVSGKNPDETRRNLRNAYSQAKERMRK